MKEKEIVSCVRPLSNEEIHLIGGGETDAPFMGIAPGGCILYPPKMPPKPKSPGDDTND
jgi:hypothetical protein